MKKIRIFQPSSIFANIIALIIILFTAPATYSELKLDNWKTYTSLSDVRSVDIDALGSIWAGTTGGVFVLHPADSSISEIRNTEGLLNMNISCVRVNPNDNSIFVCSSNGTIQIYNSEGGWDYVTDILSAKFPDPLITDIVFNDDTAYISGGFGLAKFNIKELVFIETVNKFGNLTSGIRANDILILNGFIWLATEEGLVRSKLGNSITNPISWDVYNIKNGLNEKKVNYLVNFNDTLYLATEKGIYKFVNDSLFDIISVVNGEAITGIVNLDGQLLYSTNLDVYNFEKKPQGYSNYRTINGISTYNNSLVCLFQFWGLSIFNNGNERNILPNTARSNSFVNLDVDSQGRVWVATKPKNETNGQGFMMFDGTDWFNFNSFTNSKINNWAVKVKSVSNGDIYISSWGGGLLKVKEIEDNGEKKFVITRYDTSNSPLTGALPSALDFVICGEIAEDPQGKIWVINYGEGSTGPLLTCFDKDENIKDFNNLESPTERQFIELGVDAYGTKWLGSNSFAKGLYYYNDNNTTDNLGDDKYGKYTKSNSSLLDNEITAIAVDKNGFIWLGTNTGLNFIYDSYPAKNGDKVSIREETHLRNQYINDIYVDAVNNKWIATNTGIWVLNEDASELLSPTILNSSNSPLVSDEVFSITSDTKTGTMYFGTKYGLSSARSLFAQPTNEYSIKCFPQPFNPKKDREMLIDGLMENSDVRILTVDGSLVRKLSAKGKLAYWDGKDESGLIPKSGIYLVVGSSLSADGRGYGKFTLINK